MNTLRNRLFSVVGVLGMCLLMLTGCDSYPYTTLQQNGTITYQNGSSTATIDLNQWTVKGTAPNKGTIPPQTTVQISSITSIPPTGLGSRQWPGPIPPSGVTDQAVQVTTGDTVAVVKRVDSISNGSSYPYATIKQTGTMSYMNGTTRSTIDLNLWKVTGTGPSPGPYAPNVTLQISNITWIDQQGVAKQQWQGAIPPSGVTDQAVQVTTGDTVGPKRK